MVTSTRSPDPATALTPPPARPRPGSDPLQLRFIRIHGHNVAYRMAGSGPALVLIHGIAGSSATWSRVMPELAQHHTVIAPDMLGHGESAKPRGDYSLGAYASGIRDLLGMLEIDRATLIGHSLGGGVAMQFAYQFPDMCERLVLVASGGLGKEVSPLLRLLTVPGSEYVLPLVLTRHLHGALARVAEVVGRTGLRPDPILTEIGESYTRLTDPRAQRAFIHTIRAVIDVAGQRVSARDRLYLAEEVPSLIVWGDRDGVIPVEHAYAAHELMPGSRLHIVEHAGHFLPSEHPDELLSVLEDFLASTEPATVTSRRWHEVLLGQPQDAPE
ncbi:MAG: alpha/beta fold hydrolase [Actinomycetota bacterium]|nr:alpha/beta fold hydrolase [Actinomycetota bacterium]